MASITIREYEHLVRSNEGRVPHKACPIPAPGFDALLRAIERDPDKLGRALRPSSISGRPSIQAQSFAGVVRVPGGTDIEILPKVVYLQPADDGPEYGRRLLIRMLASVPEMELMEPGVASLGLNRFPLLEFFINQLLRSVLEVIHRGIRHDYRAVADSEPFIRGRILVAEQVRRNLARQHLCHNEHDQFSPNCPENRLLKTAVETVLKVTRDARNQQLARELSFCFDEIPLSPDFSRDLADCRRDPSMSHYRPALRWSALILDQMRPTPTAGQEEVQSLLFAMEDLFECYVFKKLRRQCHRLDHRYRVRRQLAYRFLAQHRNQRMFMLKPDLSIELDGKPVQILDTKWKLLNTISPDALRRKYDISQSDVYQLFAYGRKYLREAAAKHVYLIYPRTPTFPRPLAHFEIEQDLWLHVLPFDLERETLLGLEGLKTT